MGANERRTTGTTERLAQLAHQAEKSGAAALWACDHLFWHTPLLEPLTSLAVAATSTSTAMLGTCVLQLPLRDPMSVARQAATLQTLSGGRFVLGLGVGSHPGEYEVAGADYTRRGRALDEGIDAMRSAWRSADDTERRYRLAPATPEIPIWVAGSSDAAIDRAARAADGWVPTFISAPDYASARGRLLECCAREGRDSESVQAAVVVMACVGDTVEVARKEGTTWLSDLYDLPAKAFERHLVAGPAEDCAAGIDAYRAAGAGHVVVMVTADQTVEHFDAIAQALAGHGASASPSPRPSSE